MRPKMMQSTVHPCGYLHNQQATTQYLICENPGENHTEQYNQLIQLGYRRDGNIFYRPTCSHCRSCLSCRVQTKKFIPNRTQKRLLKLNQNITTQWHNTGYNQEHETLYIKYLQQRHEKNNSLLSMKQGYLQHICQTSVNTKALEFRLDNQLIMVSIIDHVHDGISSVYTFYDTSNPQRSLGTFNILWQIQWAIQHQISWVYLGYWIKQAPKMTYKSRFQPLELFHLGEWIAFDQLSHSL